MKKLLLIPSVLFLVCQATEADTWVQNARVTQIATTQLFAQNAIVFKIDKGSSDCPAGSYIYWYNNNVDQLKTWYASILAVHLADKPILVHFQNQNCITDSVGLGT
jgi:hypothetical protein